jgi:regulator of sigma E protease
MFSATNHTFYIDSVLENGTAKKAGLQKNDKIISIDNEAIKTFGQFSEIINKSIGKKINLVILRNNIKKNIDLEIDSTGLIGIMSNTNYAIKEYSFGEAVKYGIDEAFMSVIVNIKGFKKIFQGKEKVQDSLQGPIGMAKIYGADWGNWFRFWKITGLISMILAFMNILPIPALDGGHVIFLTIEAVTRKKFSDKFMERAQVVGMVILLSLMVFAVGNDFYKLFK